MNFRGGPLPPQLPTLQNYEAAMPNLLLLALSGGRVGQIQAAKKFSNYFRADGADRNYHAT